MPTPDLQDRVPMRICSNRPSISRLCVRTKSSELSVSLPHQATVFTTTLAGGVLYDPARLAGRTDVELSESAIHPGKGKPVRPLSNLKVRCVIVNCLKTISEPHGFQIPMASERGLSGRYQAAQVSPPLSELGIDLLRRDKIGKNCRSELLADP